jgi:hypothetical protein
MTRNRLPGRRPSVGFLTEWQGHEFAVTVGIDPASGAPLEVFANAKRGAMHSTISSRRSDRRSSGIVAPC